MSKLKIILIAVTLLLSCGLIGQQKANKAASSYESTHPGTTIQGNMVNEAKQQIVVERHTKKVRIRGEKRSFTDRSKSNKNYKTTVRKVISDSLAFKSDDLDEVEEIMELENKAGLEVDDNFAQQNYYFEYLTSKQNKRDYEALRKAYKLNSSSKELQFEMSKYYEKTEEKAEKRKMLSSLKQTVSEPLKEYAYNTLMSIEQNGILVTYGKNDTYPLWIAQEIENTRKDITILNYDLLMDDEYRNSKSKELGLSLSKSYSSQLDILEDIALKNSSKKIYYSLTVSHILMDKLKDNLYPVGLAFKYSKTPVSNVKAIKTNWENKFKIAQLKSSTKTGEVRKMEMNYLLPLSQLARWYKSNGKTKQYEEIKTICLQVGDRNGKKSEVKEIFKTF